MNRRRAATPPERSLPALIWFIGFGGATWAVVTEKLLSAHGDTAPLAVKVVFVALWLGVGVRLVLRARRGAASARPWSG